MYKTNLFSSQISGRVVRVTIRKTTGDRTGVLYINSGTEFHVSTHSTRTHGPVNYVVLSSGELYLPPLTVLTGTRKPSLQVYGVLREIEELRLFKGTQATLYIQGASMCANCSLYSGRYWFKVLKMMQGALLTISSESKDIKKQTVTLHVQHLHLDYTSNIVGDVVFLLTNFMNVEYDASVDTSSRGWPASQGPGYSGGRCSNVAGAGHGGRGGAGYQKGCATCSSAG